MISFKLKKIHSEPRNYEIENTGVFDVIIKQIHVYLILLFSKYTCISCYYQANTRVFDVIIKQIHSIIAVSHDH